MIWTNVNCRLRSLGSAALNMAMVASGCADVYYEWGIHCWDMAAGKLLIEEAGGVVTNTEGRSTIIMTRYSPMVLPHDPLSIKNEYQEN